MRCYCVTSSAAVYLGQAGRCSFISSEEIGLVDRSVRTFIVVLGCDLVDGGSALGPESIARCAVGLLRRQQYNKFRKRTEIILTAGMGDRKNYPRQKKTMAGMMAEWFVANGVPRNEIFVEPDPDVWGTRAELRSAIRRLRSHGQLNYVELVSSEYHARRIKLVAERIAMIAGVYPKFGFGTFVTDHPSPLKKREQHKYAVELTVGRIYRRWYRLPRKNPPLPRSSEIGS